MKPSRPLSALAATVTALALAASAHAYTYRVPVPGLQVQNCPSAPLVFDTPQTTVLAVPSGCSVAVVSVSGAAGAAGVAYAGGYVGEGGRGYTLSASIPLNGQTVLQVVVGQGGVSAGGYGHGGGLSAICSGPCSDKTALVVAAGGGGGGAGGYSGSSPGLSGSGVNALSSGPSGLGADGGAAANPHIAWSQYTGGGGMQGGGGGGGYFGGAGGYYYNGYVYGGAGGSSYVAPGVQFVSGAVGNIADGKVTIQFH